MTAVEVARLFKLDLTLKLPRDKADKYTKLITLGYREIEYDDAKKELLSVIKKYGKDRDRFWYIQTVYDRVIRQVREGEIERTRQHRSRKTKTYY